MSKINIHPIFADIFSPFMTHEAEAISREALAQAIAECGDEADKCDCPYPMLSKSIRDFCGKATNE